MFEHGNYHTISQKMTRLQGKLTSEIDELKIQIHLFLYARFITCVLVFTWSFS